MALEGVLLDYVSGAILEFDRRASGHLPGSEPFSECLVLLDGDVPEKVLDIITGDAFR